MGKATPSTGGLPRNRTIDRGRYGWLCVRTLATVLALLAGPELARPSEAMAQTGPGGSVARARASLPPPPNAKRSVAVPAPDTIAPNAADTTPSVAAAPKRGGDVVTLRTGSVISNVQVVSRLPDEIVVEVCEGVTLRLPKRQIAGIEYDKLEAADVRRMRTEGATPEQAQLIPGQKMPDVSERLSKDISRPPVAFDRHDAVAVMKQMCQRAGVSLLVDPSVESLPAHERQLTFSTVADEPLTLLELLREELPRQSVRLRAVYQFDRETVRVVLATTEAAERLEAEGAVAEPEALQRPTPMGTREASPIPHRD